MTKQTATTIKAQNVPAEILAQIEALLQSANVSHTIVTNELVEFEVKVDFAKVAEAQEDDSFKAGLAKALEVKRSRQNVNSQLAAIL